MVQAHAAVVWELGEHPLFGGAACGRVKDDRKGRDRKHQDREPHHDHDHHAQDADAPAWASWGLHGAISVHASLPGHEQK